MSAELIIAELLNDASITNLVGNRKALVQLPKNTQYPALVYTVIDTTPEPTLSYQTADQMARARIQFNPLAKNIASVASILTALRNLLDFKHNDTVLGHKIVSCRLDVIGPVDRDNDIGVWTQPADYVLMYYE
jgi:hypothetical protein